MFGRNGFKLKSNFRKILSATNEIYQEPIKLDEAKSISFMWTKIFGDNSFVLISRFQKQKVHLGFRISTNFTYQGYFHQVIDVVQNSDISQFTHIENGDTLLEVNGINLLQLSYSELSILLGSLPINIQFVYMKKESEYEKIDTTFSQTTDDKYNSLKGSSTGWTFPINIIVQVGRKQAPGLEFINNSSSLKNISKCAIQRIHSDGYIFNDKRISVNDSIVRINNTPVHNYQDKEMIKLFQSNKYTVLMLCIGKYNANLFGSNFEFMNNERPKSVMEAGASKLGRIESRRNSKSQIITPMHSLDTDDFKDVKSIIRHTPLAIQIDQSDDMGIYLVDMKNSQNKKSIIIGFNENSKLKTKFRIGDEILKINDESVDKYTSLEIGKLLKKYHTHLDSLTVTVFRSLKPFKSSCSLIIPPESIIENLQFQNTPDVSATPTKPVEIKNQISSLVGDNRQVFNVTLHKTNNTFGLYIQSINGPTITKVTPDSEMSEKNIIKPGDKIVRINDIYVLNKEHEFILTLIRSCGKTINLEMLRITESTNSRSSNYYPSSDPESSVYKRLEKVDDHMTNDSCSENQSPTMPKIREFLTKLEIKAM